MCSTTDIEDTNSIIKHDNKYKDINLTDDIWCDIIKEFSNNEKTIKNKKDLQSFRLYIQMTYKIVLSNCNLIKIYNHLNLNNEALKNIITKKKMKSNSGVLVITVLTSANPEYIDDDGNKRIAKFSCKHDCAYCPNELAHEGNNWVNQPRSYLFSEPAVLRANDNGFDAIKQMNSRLTTLLNMGHELDKLELIVLGGTWSEYPKQYQYRFITELYYSANVFFDIVKRPIKSLEEEITINESSQIHIIGLTLETRPDTITIEEIQDFRKYNCTRIQLGVQHTDNSILKKINRGHDIQSVYDAIKLLKNNCFKVDIHIMPNLPSSSYDNDVIMLHNILYNDNLQVDQIKIYPCAVVPFTTIKKWYDNGEYIPYSEELLFKLIKDFKQSVHPYIRLNRIIRDIPSSYISGGYDAKSVNMRQLLQTDMRKNNWKCKCIRCREIGDNVIDGDIKLKVIYYKSSGADEYYISYETDKYLLGFIRLRINREHDNILPILKDCALIRELHIYSSISPVGNNDKVSIQHKGWGKKLLDEAERIAINNMFSKIAIISGTGVRNYYRKYGYELYDTYMIKKLQLISYKCILQ